THFRLMIRAIRVDLDAVALEGNAASRWLSLDDLDMLGTPAPVRKLLEDQARLGLF
ncbi:MAG TPA: A/G-specific adenine glycosylase, partial [Cupriavidus sp.]|nr:A/G-specific adenine glycosylase [Cupriavidus sp.]